MLAFKKLKANKIADLKRLSSFTTAAVSISGFLKDSGDKIKKLLFEL